MKTRGHTTMMLNAQCPHCGRQTVFTVELADGVPSWYEIECGHCGGVAKFQLTYDIHVYLTGRVEKMQAPPDPSALSEPCPHGLVDPFQCPKCKNPNDAEVDRMYERARRESNERVAAALDRLGIKRRELQS